jgi:hypothetical protein
LVEFASGLDAEQRRAAEEGLNDDELALFDLLFRETITKADREKLKQPRHSPEVTRLCSFELTHPEYLNFGRVPVVSGCTCALSRLEHLGSCQ